MLTTPRAMKPSMVFGHRNVLAVVVPSARRVALARPSEPRARSSVGWSQLLSGRTALDTTAHAWLHALKSASSAECPNFILVVQSMSESRRPCLASVSPTVCRLNASNRRQARPTACADHDVCVACAVLLGDPVQGECGPESSAPMAAEPAREWITSTRTIHRHAPMGDGTALAQAAPRHHGLLPHARWWLRSMIRTQACCGRWHMYTVDWAAVPWLTYPVGSALALARRRTRADADPHRHRLLAYYACSPCMLYPAPRMRCE